MTQPDRPELASHIISKKWYNKGNFITVHADFDNFLVTEGS
jgi:hypothetical protein